jgi:DNA-binding MarR family transcriptional regulator/GNAT superfamily N-acetyltransferase
MTAKPDIAQVEALRGFNRFYTRQIGVLEEGLLKTPFTLAQARVLFELGTRKDISAGEISAVLSLDLGYLSRIVQEFSAQGLITRKKSAEDGRRVLLSLTAKGRKAFQALDTKSRDEVAAMLAGLPDARRARLLAAIRDVQRALSDQDGTPGDGLVIRARRPGDIGWAIERHAQLYAEEYQWNEEFESLVAKLFARFANEHDPEKERLWIAECEGERVGCVFVVRNDEDPTAAQLRCLLVDPKGRGMGVGRRLVAECIAFARSAGYRRMVLWTNDLLVSARRIYEAAGFTLVEEERHHSFGHDLVGQIWSLELQ